MKRNIVLALLLAAVLVFTLVMTGCGEKEEAAEAEETSQFEGLVDVKYGDWEIGKPGGTLVTAMLTDPKTFNLIVAEENSTTDVTDRLVAGLVRRNQQTLEWEVWGAESYEISDDQKSITYKIRKDWTWSDGTPVTAQDWVWPVNNLYLEEELEGSTKDSLVVSGEPIVWEAIDDYTIKVTFPVVYAGIFNKTTLQPIPTHIVKPLVEEQGVAAVNSWWGVDTDVSEIVSCGPWLVGEYVPSQRVVLKKNPDYFEKDAKGNSLPYLDEVIYETIESQDTQLARAVAGDLDFHDLRGEDYAVLVDKKEEVGFELYNVGPSTSTEFITFNQNPIEGEDDNGIAPPQLTWLSNLKFRTAMAHLIDRESIINNVAYGFGYPQYSFVPRFSPYYWDGVDDAAPKYDPEKAKELLDEIGYVDTDDDGIREDPDGNKISLNLYTNSGNTTREQIGTIFAQEAAKVGIEVNFQPEDFNALVTRLVSSYDWELVIIGLTGSVDPISGSNVYPSSGSLHMIEPNQESPRRDWEKAVDEAWDEANNTTDEAQRKSGYEKLQRLWAENLPWAYTYNAAFMHLYDANLGNVQPQPTEDYDWEGILTRLYYKE